MISGALSAGLSLAQAVDTVVREGPEPIASEFKRVLVEARIGMPIEDAFEGVAQRFESKDFAWSVMAIRIQRQVGGNLAESAQHGRRHDARAGLPAPPGAHALGRGPVLRHHPVRDAAAVLPVPLPLRPQPSSTRSCTTRGAGRSSASGSS
ncbi:hypothetical protein G5V59_06760 [Nocardioides sp. W3-2-3]|nr:hypothetical protein [Nocardioides convexus]